MACASSRCWPPRRKWWRRWGWRSLDIHQDVQQIVARGLSVYEIDTDALVRARPKHIITQDQCEVCAVTRTDVMRATRQCLGTDASILTLHPDRLDDIFSDIRTV